MIRRCMILCAFLVFSLVANFEARGQSSFQKTNDTMLATFAEVVAKPSEYTVRIRCADKDAALGAVVRPDGWILTKASELKGDVVCKLKDNRELPAKLVGVHKDYDLALLKIETSGLPVAEWKKSTEVEVGAWLVTPGLGTKPVAVGVMSVAKRDMPRGRTQRSGPPVRANPRGGFLGVTMQDADVGVKVRTILPKSAAAKAGMKVDDVVVMIDYHEISDMDSMLLTLGKYKPGDEITVRLLRESRTLELKAVLAKRPPDFAYLEILVEDVDGVGVKVLELSPTSSLAKAGMMADDIIIGVGATDIRDMEGLEKALAKFRPKEEVTFKLKRDGVATDVKLRLPPRPMGFDRGAMQNSMGGTLSERRFGFPVILQHDTVLKPSECGGPVVDLDGKVIGINIARAGRTETYAIPSEVVENLLPDMLAGKFPVAEVKKAITAADRLKAAETVKAKALSDKEAAEKKLKDAEEAIRKAKAEIEVEKKKDEKKPDPANDKKDEKKPDTKKDDMTKPDAKRDDKKPEPAPMPHEKKDDKKPEPKKN